MAKKKKIFKRELKEIRKEEIEVKIFENVHKISLNEYLSLYNRQRVLDNVIKKWFFRIDPLNPKKTKEEWDKLLFQFHNETER